MKFVWSPRAIHDLAHVRSYIGRDNPETAQRVVATIVTYTEQQLDQFPTSGCKGRVPGTLELVVLKLPFVIPYRIVDDHIDIIRV